MSETILHVALGVTLVLWLCTSWLLVHFRKKQKIVLSEYMSLKLKHQTLQSNHSALIGMYADVEMELKTREDEDRKRDIPRDPNDADEEIDGELFP